MASKMSGMESSEYTIDSLSCAENSQWDSLNPLKLAVAIEPECCDLLMDRTEYPRAARQASALVTGAEDAMEAFEKTLSLTGADWKREMHSFLHNRYRLCLEQHGRSPYADHDSPEMSRQLNLKGRKSDGPLNPPETRVENALCIHDITREDMRERSLRWLHQMADHLSIEREDARRKQVTITPPMPVVSTRPKRSWMRHGEASSLKKALVFVVVGQLLLYLLYLLTA